MTASVLSAGTVKLTSFFTGDILFLAILFVIFFVYAIYLGRSRMISLILSFYPATLLYKTFPFIDKITASTGNTLLLVKFGIFLVFLIPINLIIGRYMFSELIHVRSSNIIQTIGLSIVMVIMIIMFSYNTINFDSLHNFSPMMDAIFAGSDRVFWWNLAPIVLLAVLSTKNKSH